MRKNTSVTGYATSWLQIPVQLSIGQLRVGQGTQVVIPLRLQLTAFSKSCHYLTEPGVLIL